MSITLNAAPVSYKDALVQVEKFPYSDDKLEQLRNANRTTHLIRRDGNEIIAVPFKKDSISLAGQPGTIDLNANLSLAKSLANNALYRELVKRDCWISSITPISYLVIKKNLLQDCMPDGVQLVKGLNVFAKWEIDFRVIDPMGKNPFIAMSVNIGTAPRIAINCQDLMVKGVSIIGYYVGKPYYGKNPELKPRFSTIGRVITVNADGMLELEDVRDGESNLADPTTLYLEPREDLLEHCINSIYGSRASEILENISTKLSAYHTGNQKFNKLITGLKNF